MRVGELFQKLLPDAPTPDYSGHPDQTVQDIGIYYRQLFMRAATFTVAGLVSLKAIRSLLPDNKEQLQEISPEEP